MFHHFLRWLNSVYVNPLKESVYVRAYVFGVTLAFFNAAGAYEDRPNMPPFYKLNSAEGTIDFADHNPTRGGAPLVVKLSESKTPLFLNCSGGSTTRKDCVPSEKRNDYRGKSGRVLWFIHEGFFGRYHKLAQLEVDGHVIVSYEHQKENYGSLGYHVSAFLIFVFLYLIAMPVRYFREHQ